MIRELGLDQEQLIRSLLSTQYANSQGKIIGAVENKAGALTFAISLKDGQYITFAEIVKPTVPVTVDKFAPEWIQEKINGSLGEAVKNCLKKRGKLNFQAFELDTRVDNETKVRRVFPFGNIEFIQVLPHTQFSFEYYNDELTFLSQVTEVADDFKKAFSKITQLSDALKTTLIEADKKKLLYEKLNECYHKLEKRNATNKEQYEHECLANYNVIKQNCDEIAPLIQGATNFTEIREKLKVVSHDLAEKILKRDKKNELYEMLHTFYAEIDKRKEEEHEEYEKNCNTNFEYFHSKLIELKEACKTTLDVPAQRQLLKETQASSWEKKLKKEQRNQLHLVFNELFESLNLRWEELKFQLESESGTNKNQLELQVEEMKKFIESSTDLKQTKEQLKMMQKSLNDMKLTPNHKQELWNLIDKAFKEINAKIEESTGAERRESEIAYNSIKPIVDEVVKAAETGQNFKEIRDKLKAAQQQLNGAKMMHRHKQELWKLLDVSFKQINERADKYFEGRKVEREQKNTEWKTTQEQRIVKLNSVIKAINTGNLNDKEYLSKLQDWLGTIKNNNATIAFRQTIIDKITGVEAQMKERADKVADIKKTIQEINSKLRDFEAKKLLAIQEAKEAAEKEEALKAEKEAAKAAAMIVAEEEKKAKELAKNTPAPVTLEATVEEVSVAIENVEIVVAEAPVEIVSNELPSLTETELPANPSTEEAAAQMPIDSTDATPAL
jgi:hypothetical protein